MVGSNGSERLIENPQAIITSEDMLDVLEEISERLAKLEKKNAPVGMAELTLGVTDEWQELKLQRPWMAFTLINDGPGDLLFRANLGRSSFMPDAPIEPGEVLTADFDSPIIESIFYSTTPGAIASIRIFAEEGQWA